MSKVGNLLHLECKHYKGCRRAHVVINLFVPLLKNESEEVLSSTLSVCCWLDFIAENDEMSEFVLSTW